MPNATINNQSIVDISHAVSLVNEALITILFWSVIFPAEQMFCGIICVSVHTVSTALLLLDFALSCMPFTMRHLPWTLGFPTTWLLVQVLWVFSGHSPCYEVLSLKDLGSLYLIMGAMLLVCILHFVFSRLVSWRNLWVRKFKAKELIPEDQFH